MATILHFEDNPWVARDVKLACSKAGLKYSWLSQPPDDLLGVIIASEAKAVLTDINMPRMDGIDVVRAIRSDSRTRSLPVVVFTTMRSEGIQKEAFAAGATDVFAKDSTTPEDVVAYLASLIA